MKTTKATLLIFVLTFTSWFLHAQNLVPNPDLETHSGCTGSISDLTTWTNPTGATTDYYNACTSFGFSVPSNILGNQAARSGVGYAGIVTYEDAGIFGPCPSGLLPTSWREYIQVQLTSPLAAGNTYCVSFFVSLADEVKYATEEMGLYLSNTPISWPDSVALPYTPQIVNTSGALNDATGWTQITGSYLATGGEEYIVIGNFSNDASTTVSCANASAFNTLAYYYVDDVYVGPSAGCPTSCALAIGFTTDSKGCGAANGDIYTSVAGSGLSYYWNTGDTTSSLIGVAEGTYYVTVSDGSGCVGSDSVVLNLLELPTAYAGADDTICRGSSISVTATGGGDYLWDTGDTVPTVILSPFGTTTYTVMVTNADGCSDFDDVTITVIQPLSIDISGPSGPFCNSDAPVSLVGSPSGGTFSGPGMSGSTFDPAAAGVGSHDVIYTVVGPTGCLSSDTILQEVVICTSLEEVSVNNEIKVYPVPFESDLFIELEKPYSGSLELCIFDIRGKMLLRREYHSGEMKIRLNSESAIAAGYYLLEIRVSDRTIPFKIVKE